MTYKDNIIEYLKLGLFDNKEIALKVGCSVRHVQIARKEYDAQVDSVILTVENYIKAILNGCKTKAEISDYFCVNRRTILRFEHKHISKKAISRYLYVYGVDIKIISHLFRLTENETEKLKELPLIAEIKEQLKTIRAVLYPLKPDSDQISEQHGIVNKLFWTF